MKTAHALSIVAVSCLVTILTFSLAIFSDDLWNYPARTFSQFDTLAQKMLGQPTKVLGEATNRVQDYTKLPIISFETSQNPDLATKINSTEEVVDQLYLAYQRVSGEVVLMGFKWDSLTGSDITKSIDGLMVVLGDIKQTKWLTQAWGWPQLDEIAVAESAVRTDLATVRGIVSTSGTIPVAFTQLKSAITSLGEITKSIGEKTDTAKQETIYGRYQQAREQAGEWDSLKSQLSEGLAAGDVSELTKLETKILALNNLPHASQALSAAGSNRWLDLMALADANKLFLASDRGSVVTTTWLVDHPVVFKTLIANTSPLARQEVDIKYYLPAELKDQDILGHDQNLEIKFDPDQKRLLVQGHATVAAGDTRTVSVQAADIWRYDSLPVEKASIQAAELAKVLTNSPHLAEAIALKSSVDASIKKIAEMQSRGDFGENRIITYRQVSLELELMNQNLTQLGQLVTKTNTLGWSGRLPLREIIFVITGLVLLGLGFWKLKQPPAVSLQWHKTLPTQQFHAFSKEITSSDL